MLWKSPQQQPGECGQNPLDRGAPGSSWEASGLWRVRERLVPVRRPPCRCRRASRGTHSSACTRGQPSPAHSGAAGLSARSSGSRRSGRWGGRAVSWEGLQRPPDPGPTRRAPRGQCQSPERPGLLNILPLTRPDMHGQGLPVHCGVGPSGKPGMRGGSRRPGSGQVPGPTPGTSGSCLDPLPLPTPPLPVLISEAAGRGQGTMQTLWAKRPRPCRVRAGAGAGSRGPAWGGYGASPPSRSCGSGAFCG